MFVSSAPPFQPLMLFDPSKTPRAHMEPSLDAAGIMGARQYETDLTDDGVITLEPFYSAINISFIMISENEIIATGNGLHMKPQTIKKVLLILVWDTGRDCQTGQGFMCIITSIRRFKRYENVYLNKIVSKHVQYSQCHTSQRCFIFLSFLIFQCHSDWYSSQCKMSA